MMHNGATELSNWLSKGIIGQFFKKSKETDWVEDKKTYSRCMYVVMKKKIFVRFLTVPLKHLKCSLIQVDKNWKSVKQQYRRFNERI